jgi:hypothetical protein
VSEEDFEPRLFESDEAIRSLGERFCACRLDKSEWTHEAHLATSLWIVVERADIAPESDLPDMIRRYNESVGGVNDETQGYHETITQTYLAGIRSFLASKNAEGRLVELVNALLQSPEGRRDWPLRFYSKGRLFSPEARLAFLEPDLVPLPLR